MAITTTQAPEEKRGGGFNQDDGSQGRTCTNKQKTRCRRTVSLNSDCKPLATSSTTEAQHALLSISYPTLACKCSYITKITNTNNKNEDRCEECATSIVKNQSDALPNRKSVFVDDSVTSKSDILNGNEGNDGKIKSDVILFIDNSLDDDSISLEKNKQINCDGPLSDGSLTSLDKISFEDYKDRGATIYGEKSKKYSVSSQKVQFADMAVFDGEGDIHLSPVLIKKELVRERNAREFYGSNCQKSNLDTLSHSIAPLIEEIDGASSSETGRSKPCTCSDSPKLNNQDHTENINNNDFITTLQCKKCNPSSNRERTMSECSYFSNVSSASIASKLTTRTESSDTSSSSSSSSSTASFSHVAPDGGWGWVIVFASFLVNMIADGVTFSVGVMFIEFQKEFGHSSSRTAGVIGLFHAVPLLSGPIASALTDRYGCRKVTIAGSILATVGFLLSSLANSLEVLYLTFGIISGFGLSLCYVAAVVIVAYYFERRRSFATGISVCGSGVGTFLFAPLTRILIEEYGWRGACVILAGCFLNMCVCGALFRELEWTIRKRKRKKMKHKLSITKSISPVPDENEKYNTQNHKRASIGSSINHPDSRKVSSGMKMPNIEELKLQILKGGSLSISYSEEDIAEETAYLTSSLCHLPTWISNTTATEGEGSKSIPEDFLIALSHNEKACSMIKDNYPDSLIALSLKDTNTKLDGGGNLNIDPNAERSVISTEVKNPVDSHIAIPIGKSDLNTTNGNNLGNLPSKKNIEVRSKMLDLDKPRINTPKLVRKVSGYFKKCQNLGDTLHQETAPNPKSILKKHKNVSYGHCQENGATGELSEKNMENGSTRRVVGRSYSCRRSSGTDALIRQKSLTQQRSMYLHRLRLRRQSLTYRGAMLNIPRYRLRSSNSCPDIFRNSMTTLAAEEMVLGIKHILMIVLLFQIVQMVLHKTQ